MENKVSKMNLLATKSLIKLLFLMSKEKNRLNDDFQNNYALCQEIANKIINDLNISFDVIGAENIPTDASTLITPNHRGFFDILILLSIIDRPTSFATAKELYNVPILKQYIESINCISIDRETSDMDEIKKQMKAMSNSIANGCTVVFPEGCANHYGDEISEFKKGAFVSAPKLDPYIVPTYIDLGKTRNFSQWLVPSEKITVSIGEPFKPSQISDRKLRPEEICEYTQEKVLELKRQITK
ncbi:MAG: lysophospholipid acyltransferase family protein [Bacilli bacterium]|nr:lysophospholipid acyltransferase family protein [Bacilli bacterium]